MVALKSGLDLIFPAQALGDFLKIHGGQPGAHFSGKSVVNAGYDAVGLPKEFYLLFILDEYAPNLFHLLATLKSGLVHQPLILTGDEIRLDFTHEVHGHAHHNQ